MGAPLEDLLLKTSRTFALAIPLLPQPTRHAVSVAYLLFRIADTFEDATTWPREERISALASFSKLCHLGPKEREPLLRELTNQCRARPPVDHAGYLELLWKLPEVMAELEAMSPAAREAVIHHTCRTADGMARVVAQADERGTLRLGSVEDLKDYCYVVAGIVGELLTDLFLLDAPVLSGVAPILRRNEVAFGEGLQLVNILKDSNDDARDGRVYLPAQTPKADIFEMARNDLERGAEYVRALQAGGAPDGFVGFTGISLVLAFASLDKLERLGPGSKVGRAEVMMLFATLQGQIASKAELTLRPR